MVSAEAFVEMFRCVGGDGSFCGSHGDGDVCVCGGFCGFWCGQGRGWKGSAWSGRVEMCLSGLDWTGKMVVRGGMVNGDEGMRV